MKYISSLLFILLVAGFCSGQDLDSQYKKADSLFNLASYEQAKEQYGTVANQAEERGNWIKSLSARLKVSEILRRTGNLDESFEEAQEIESLVPQIEDIKERELILAGAYDCIGIIHDYNSEFHTAIKYYSKSLDLRLRHLEANDLKVAVNYNNLGIVYDLMGQYDSSLHFHNKAIAIRRFHQDTLMLASSYYNAALVYDLISEFEKAIQLHDSALVLRRRVLGKDHPYLAYSYSAIAGGYNRLGNYYQAISFNKAAMNLFLKSNKQIEASYSITGIANQYNSLGEYELSKKYSRKSLKIRKKLLSKDNFRISQSHLILAETFISTGDLDSALFFLEKVEKYKSLNQNTDHIGDLTNFLFAKVYLQRREPRNALNKLKDILIDTAENNTRKYRLDLLLQSAIAYKNLEKLDSARIIVDRIFKAGIEKQLNNFTLLPVLEVIQLNYELSVNDDLDSKKEILGQFYYADSIASKGYSQILTFHDKLRFLQETSSLYYKAVKCAFELYEATTDHRFIDDAFYFSERSKSRILFESLARNQVLNNQVRKHLNLENKILDKISDIEEKLGEVPEGEERIDLNDQLVVQNIRYDSLRKHYSNSGLNLFETLFYPDRNVLQERLEQLDDNTALIEYLVNEEVQFVFVITKEKKQLIKLPFGQEMMDVSSELHNSTKLQKNGSSFSKWVGESYELFESVVQPYYNYLKESDIKQLKVVDGIIEKVPLGILITSLPDTISTYSFAQLNYLLKEFEIDYLYSFTLQDDLETKSVNLNNILGIAPAYPDSLKLLFNQKEVDWIASLLDSDQLKAGDASETNVKEKLDKYEVLHFAAHSQADLEDYANSKLIFLEDSINDGQLHGHELFDMNLEAKLVFLNTCASGLGPFIDGEGNMSLARTFKNNGSNTVIFNQWEVDDRFAFEFTKEFYKNLSEEKDLKKAFRTTQLSLINNEKNPELANPYYWASFVVLGENLKVEDGENGYIKWLAIGLFLLLGVSLFLKYRK